MPRKTTMTSIHRPAASAAALTLLLLQSIVVSEATPPSPPPPSAVTRRRSQSQVASDGDLRFHEATFIASHNSHAALAVVPSEDFILQLGTNQDDAIIDQLAADGVRGLMLDVQLDEEKADEPLRLVHANSIVTLDYGGFRSGMGYNLIPFLEENADAIVSIFLEPRFRVDQDEAEVGSAILGHVRDAFSTLTVMGVPLRDMTFKYDDGRWSDHEEWPRLEEIRRSGQRVFVFSDRPDFADPEFGFMYNRHVMQENDWEGIDDCEERYMWGSPRVSLPSNDAWTRLFFMNHFCCGSGPDAKGGTVGEDLIGGGNNGWGRLYVRVLQCMSNNGGFKPNFIALDWVSQSREALEIRDFLNFGGRIGTGQACDQDSHCATSSCNVGLSVCQCQQCPLGSPDVCPGCAPGQYCSSPDGGGINSCEGSSILELIVGLSPSSGPSTSLEPTKSISPGEEGSDAPSLSPSGGADGLTQSPTKFKLEDGFYCGEDYFLTVSNCNEAVKCPGGNDDCPTGQTCFAGITDCTPSPTLPPSDRPSDLPSFSQSTSGPTLSASLGGVGNSLGGVGDSLGGVGDSLGGVGDGATSNGGGSAPDWLADLGLTSAPVAPTSSPSQRPTEAPFDFENKYFCGANYTDAALNCYRLATPCPTGSPSVCKGGTCFSGITCTAPPTAPPTLSPASSPTSMPGKSSNGAPSGAGTPGDAPYGKPNVMPNGLTPGYPSRTFAPFDEQLFIAGSNGAMTSVTMLMSGKHLLLVAGAVIGLIV